MNLIIPNIIEKNYNGEKIYDIYSKLLDNRIIFLNGEITDNISTLIISQLLYLDSLSNEDIFLYINSPGGSVTAGLSIYDTMNYIKSDVSTVATGLCASMAAVILAAGTKGKRLSLKNSEIMIHQVLGGTQGQATDIKIQAERILEIKKKLNKILAIICNKTINKITKDTERDFYLSPIDAIDYGLIDKII
ncbi:MAG: ATP-dependent Clp protease proteolytic subunit [Bacilli bacterium]|nr:ATP-dependent Clp protease proteolytic subunit [Bacilli bacterium]MDD4406847.1 ATP-dependent Clp protease proteolytic subunit [Bacilli bacterium]